MAASLAAGRAAGRDAGRVEGRSAEDKDAGAVVVAEAAPLAVAARLSLSLALRDDSGRPILLLLVVFSSPSLGGFFTTADGIDAPHECVDAPLHVPPPEAPASGGWVFRLGNQRSYHLESTTRGLRSTAPPDSPLLRLFGPVGAADGDSNEDSVPEDFARAGAAVVKRRGGKPRLRALRFGRSERGCFPCEDALEASRGFGNEASSPFPFDNDISQRQGAHALAHEQRRAPLPLPFVALRCLIFKYYFIFAQIRGEAIVSCFGQSSPGLRPGRHVGLILRRGSVLRPSSHSDCGGCS